MCGTEVLAQATATTNDIQLAAILLAALYFTLVWIKEKSWSLAILGGLAWGVAGGVKITLSFIAPWICLFFIVEWRKIYNFFFSSDAGYSALRQVACAAVLALIIASPFMLYNHSATGQFMPKPDIGKHVLIGEIKNDKSPFENRVRALAQNFPTYIFQALTDPLQHV